MVGGGGAGLRAAIAIAEADPQLERRGRLEGLPDAQPHRLRRGRRRRRDRARTTASTSTPTTPSRAATGSATRTPSRPSSRRRPRSCCSSSTGAARGAASRTGTSRCAPFGGMKKMRTWFAADKTGFHMLHALFQTSLKYDERRPLRRVVRHQAAGRRRPRAGRGRRSSCDRRRSRRSPRKAVILCHRRLRQGLPVHHQRQHQDRRRHGAGLPRRRAAQGHGVRPVPPDRAARSPAS